MKSLLHRFLLLLMVLLAQTLSAATVSTPDAARGANIKVTFAGITAPGARDWVGIYAAGSGYGSGAGSLLWQYTSGSASGSISFSAPTLAAGSYVARLFSNDSYTLLASANFNIAAASAGPALSCPGVTTGSPIICGFSGASGNTRDWIGVYRQGTASTAYLTWKYLPGSSSGSVSLASAGLAAGTYSARLFSDNGYTLLASQDFPISTPPAGPALSSVVSNGSISASFSGISSPTYRDWVGLFLAGAGDRSYLAYEYTPGGSSGSVSFPVAGLNSGDYQLRLFTNDSYTRLASASLHLAAPAISAVHSGFLTGEGLEFSYANLPAHSWIGLYAEGAADLSHLASASLSQTLGTQSFASLPEGYYEARVFTGAFSLVAKTRFRVRAEYRKATHISLADRGQTHGVGRPVAAGGGFDQRWRADDGQSGLMSATLAAGMRQGSYSGLVQLWHDAAPGSVLGTLMVVHNDSIVASSTVSAETISLNGDFQYAKIDFNLTATGDVELQFHSAGDTQVDTSVMSLFRINGKKPVYVWGHRRNNQLRANQAVTEGCNATEVDVRPENVGGQFKLTAHHHDGEVDWTPSTGWDEFLALNKQHMDNGLFANLYLDIKPPPSGYSYDDYAHELLSQLKALGFDPGRIVIGTDAASDFRQAAIDLDFDIVTDWYAGEPYAGWFYDQEKYSQLQEFNGDASTADEILDITEAIYNRGKIKKTYFWTIVNNASYYDNTYSSFYTPEETQKVVKRLLILGMDGVMGDDGAPITAVMSLPVFGDIFRLATPTDDMRTVHGEN